MMGHREKLKSGDEWDVVSNWRKVLCSTQRAGVCKSVKTKLNRRARKDARLNLARMQK